MLLGHCMVMAFSLFLHCFFIARTGHAHDLFNACVLLIYFIGLLLLSTVVPRR